MEIIMALEVKKEDVVTIFDLLEKSADTFGDKTLIRYEENYIVCERSYKQIYEDSNRLAHWIAEMGAQLGHRIHAALIGRTSCEYLEAMFGTVGGNGVAIPMDIQLTKDNMIKNLTKADTDVLFYDWEFRSQVTYISERCPGIKKVICLQDIKGFDSVSGILNGRSAAADLPRVDPSDCALIIFTSGTTGDAKGVMLSHANEIDNAFCSDESEDMTKEILLNVLPIHHIFCINCDILMTLRFGSTICLCTDPKKLMHALTLFEPTFVRMVPMMAKAVINRYTIARKQNPDMPEDEVRASVWGKNLKRIGSGGGYLSPELANRFLELGLKIGQGYGMSECSPKICVPDYDRPDKVSSVGRPVRGCSIRTEDGELQVKSPSVMMGYYKDEERTAEMFTEDGWLRTGDLGYVDDDGFVYLTGRKKNLIIFENGENVSPEAIENLFDGDPIISDIIVFGKDEKIAAEVYPNFEYAQMNGISNIESAVSAVVDERNMELPTYSQIASVTVRKTPFETTSSKKIIRSKYFTEKEVKEEKARSVIKPQTELQQQIFDVVTAIIGNDLIGIDDDLHNNGLDSLGTVMFIEDAEAKLGRTLTFNDLSKYRTIKEIEEFFLEEDSKPAVDYTPRDKYPLTSMQMYFGYVIRGNTTGNLPFTFELNKDIDLDRLKTAIEETIDAHPYLKGIIKPSEQKYLMTYRDDNRKIDIPIEQLSDSEWENRIKEILVPFAYDGNDELFHIRLFKTETKKYMIFDVSHIAGDGMTMNILLEDVNKRYLGQPIEKETYTFYEYVLDHTHPDMQLTRKQNTKYYEDLLKGANLERSILNKKDKEDISKESNAVIRRRFDSLNKKKLLYFCKQNGISENVLFLTAFNYCVGLFSDQKSVFTNSIHSGRTDGRWRRLAGPLFLTYFSRYDVVPHETTRELLRRAGLQIMDTMRCSISVPREGEMFFQYQGDIIDINEIGGLPAERLHLQLDSLPFHMQVMTDDKGYYTELRYWDNRFDKDMIDIFITCYESIVKAMPEEKSARMLKHHLPEDVFPRGYSVSAAELNAEAGYTILKNVPTDTRVRLYVLDERYRKKPIGAWGRLYVQDLEPDNEQGVINYPYQKGKILHDTGITARILPDGRIDFLENSGRTVLTDGSKGRRYYDLSVLEKSLSEMKNVERCKAYMIYDADSNEMKLAMDVETNYDSFVNRVRSYTEQNLGERLTPAVVNIISK